MMDAAIMEVRVGQTIEDAAHNAVRLANEHQKIVKFSFQDIYFNVRPGTTADRLVFQYDANKPETKECSKTSFTKLVARFFGRFA